MDCFFVICADLVVRMGGRNAPLRFDMDAWLRRMAAELAAGYGGAPTVEASACAVEPCESKSEHGPKQ
jgi:hypothetical protein